MPRPLYENLVLAPDTKSMLENWLWQELNDAENKANQQKDAWNELDRKYESKPLTASKSYPWENSSNTFIPLTAIHTDQLFSKFYGSIFSLDEFWIVKPSNKKYIRHAKPVQRWLNWAVRNQLNLAQGLKSPIKEAIKLGTSVIKFYYKFVELPRVKYDPEGRPILSKMVIHDAPAVEHVRLHDILKPNPHLEIENDRWVAENFRVTWTQLNELVYDGFFDRDVVDDLYTYFIQNPQQYESKQEALHKRDQTLLGTALFDLQEVYARIDINNDGLAEDVTLWFERNSRKILKVIYNAYHAGWWPYLTLRYLRRDGWWYGKGVPELLENLNAELNTIHNQRIDNGSIANIKTIVARSGAHTSLKPNEGIYPGKVIFADDPDKDVRAFSLGEIHASQFQEEQLVLQYAERLTGVTDPMVGRLGSGAGTRTPGSVVTSLMQQAASRLSLGIDDARSALEELGLRYIEMAQQFYTDDASREKLLTEIFSEEETEAIQMVREVLDMPIHTTRQRFGLELSVVSQVINRDIERQAENTKLQTIMSIGERVFQMAQMVVNPQTPPPLKTFIIKLVGTIDKHLERLQQLHDEKDPTLFSPLLEELQNGSSALPAPQTGIGGEISAGSSANVDGFGAGGMDMRDLMPQNSFPA